MQKVSAGALKNIALLILAVPIGFLLLFTFGEVFGGDISGLSHLIQAAPLIILAYLAWKKPFLGGILILAFAIVLAIVFNLMMNDSLTSKLLVSLILFLPPVVSSILLITASKKTNN